MKAFNPVLFLGAFAASMILNAAGFAILDRLIIMLVVATIYAAVVGMLSIRDRR